MPITLLVNTVAAAMLARFILPCPLAMGSSTAVWTGSEPVSAPGKFLPSASLMANRRAPFIWDGDNGGRSLIPRAESISADEVTKAVTASPTLAVPLTIAHTFDDPTVTQRAEFGGSVAVDGNNILIGAPFANLVQIFGIAVPIGQAHLFDASNGDLLQTFDDPTPTTSNHFGISVAIDGNNVLIGARSDNTKGTNVGQAHLFTPPQIITTDLLGDLDLNGKVDILDFGIFADQFGEGSAGGAITTPEPATLLLLIGAIPLLWNQQVTCSGRPVEPVADEEA